MEVLVFKTNITEQAEVSRVHSLLSGFADIKQVTVDLEDCDKVLRIVWDDTSPVQIKLIVDSLGLVCTELED